MHAQAIALALALGTHPHDKCETDLVEDDELLSEQVAFYRARAPRYDDWWQHRGAYAMDAERSAEWDRQLHQVEEELRTFSPTGTVVEFAGGTGWWSEKLAAGADHLTVIDSSPEVLEINRTRTARAGQANIDYVQADLFSWIPDRAYDVVFFSFWLSHVPRRRFAAFWSLVRSCLAPGGRVFLVDNHDEPLPAANVRDPYVLHYEPDRHVRRLEDGRQFNVVKVMYEPDELEARLEDLGWTADIKATRWFLFGSAQPG